MGADAACLGRGCTASVNSTRELERQLDHIIATVHPHQPQIVDLVGANGDTVSIDQLEDEGAQVTCQNGSLTLFTRSSIDVDKLDPFLLDLLKQRSLKTIACLPG